MSINLKKIKNYTHPNRATNNLDCFSKINLDTDLDKIDLSKNIKYFKKNTFNIGNSIANLSGEVLNVGSKKMKFLDKLRKKIGKDHVTIDDISILKYGTKNIKNHNQEILNLKNTSFKQNIQSNSRDFKTLNNLKDKNVSFLSSILKQNHLKEYSQTKVSNISCDISKNQFHISEKKEIPFYEGHDEIKTWETIKQTRKRLISINNTSFESQQNKNFFQTETPFSIFDTNNSNNISFNKKDKFLSNKSNKMQFSLLKNNTIITKKSINKSLNSFIDIPNLNSIKNNVRSRTNLHLSDYLKYNPNTKFLNIDLPNIKTEISEIENNYNNIYEEINKLSIKLPEKNLSKMVLNEDFKSLDKIVNERTIYIYGNTMVKPKIINEKDDDIFSQSDKISKLSSAAAYYSKDLLFEKFKIVQNNLNPNLINFKIKKISREKEERIKTENKLNDRFNLIQGMLKTFKNKERQILNK